MHRDQAPGAAPPGERPDSRRRPPRTDAVLADPRLAEAARRLGRPLVKTAVVDAQERARRGQIAPADVADEALLALPPTACALCPVLNAIGVLLHTNLGRAALSEAARQAVLAAGATDVEFDLASGDRAPRGRSTVRALLDRVPAAQAAHVVNNGAAALVLAATALAQGARSSSAGASWSRSATASACPTCSPRRARGCARSARPTGRPPPTTPPPSGTPPASSSGSIRPTSASPASPALQASPNSPLLPDEPDAEGWLRAGADLVTASGVSSCSAARSAACSWAAPNSSAPSPGTRWPGPFGSTS